MRNKSILIWTYAAFIFLGGLMGFFLANSLPSLISSSISTLLLIICGYGMWKNKVVAYHSTTGLLFVLFAFFGYRLMSTMKVFPGGVMTVITGALLIYFITQLRDINQNFSKQKL